MSPDAFHAVRRLSALASFAVALGASALAHARVYGERHITTSTTLHDDQYGSVVIDADNVTLDCAWFQVHISSSTRPNCAGGYGKCGIVVTGHTGVQIRRCNVVGDFDGGIAVWDSFDTSLTETTVTVGAGTGISVEDSSGFEADDVAVTGGQYGVMVGGSDSCSFGDFLVQDASVAALSSFNDTNTQFYRAEVENSLTGYYGYGDSNEMVTGSWFAGNGNSLVFEDSTFPLIAENSIIDSKQNGIVLLSTDQAVVQDNVVSSSGSCDAKMLSSTNSLWQRNSFGRICNDVPRQH